MKKSEQVGELVAALAKAQAEFGSAVKDSDNPYYGSKYADLSAVIGAVRPALNKNGIAMMHTLESDLERQCAIVTVGLYHGEQFMEVTVEAPATGRAKKDERNEGAAPTKFDVQTIGACWSYLRRYTLQAICGLASEDDDGESLAGSNKPIPKKTLCPLCGKDAIIQGKPEYGGGWLCYKQKGGCGAKFTFDPALEQESHEPAGAPATPPPARPATQPPPAAHSQPQSQVGQLKFIVPDGLITVIKGIKEVAAQPAEGERKASKAYMIVNFLGQHNGVGFASCFDTKYWELLKESIGLECHFQIKEADKGGSHFINIVDVIYVDGQEYKEGKPVTA